ncbi:MAG TPA: M1 family metallopeptidase [Bacteroidota bacterium]
MRIPVFLLLAVTFSLARAVGQLLFVSPLSDRVVTYRIDVRLDDSAKSIAGTEHLTWRNPSAEPVGDLQFHLYLNAFKNSSSTAMKESNGGFVSDRGWGSIDVLSMKLENGVDLRGQAAFISPDDGNAEDQTVLRVPLPSPVGPGKTIALDIQFTAKLPKISERTGYSERFFMIAQWFPKLGVYEPRGMRYATRGAWNCHQFHAVTEFYADFGVYDVNITVPRGFLVGATGIRERETSNADGTVTLGYHAEDVHDFAWAASPDLAEATDTWHHVALRLLTPPERLGQAHRLFAAAQAALEYMDAHVGAYPYPELTIVDVPGYARGAGGMEYPTLFTTISSIVIPEGVRLPELVVTHEFIHQYFQGMVATNEFEEAWMDEGFTQYYEGRVMNATYGSTTSYVDLLGFHFGDFAFNRMAYTTMADPRAAPIAGFEWQSPRREVFTLTYNKTAVMLQTLQGLLGDAAMDSVMATYFRRWRFRHPSGRDFIAVVNEVVPRLLGEKFGKEMNWFFDQVLYGTGVCDYEATSIRVRPAGGREGEAGADSGAAARAGSDGGDSSRAYLSEIRVSRLGDVWLPVEVQVRFSDGSQVTEQWDGKDAVKIFRYTRQARAVRAAVDPERKLLLDRNIANNVRSVSAPEGALWKYTFKVLFWLQNIFHGAAMFL